MPVAFGLEVTFWTACGAPNQKKEVRAVIAYGERTDRGVRRRRLSKCFIRRRFGLLPENPQTDQARGVPTGGLDDGATARFLQAAEKLTRTFISSFRC